MTHTASWGIVAVLAACALPVLLAQAPTREEALEQENLKLRQQIAESRKLTPDQVQQRYTDFFVNGSQSVGATACVAAKGQAFTVIVAEGKVSVSCTFDVKHLREKR